MEEVLYYLYIITYEKIGL